MKHLLLLLLLWPLLALAAGEDKEAMVFMGEPEVSTPSRRPQSAAESPSPVSVLTAEEIRRAGALTLPDALALLPGVNVLRLSEASTEVSIRGFNGYRSDKVLVMLDGVPLCNLADASADWNLIPVALEDLDRIELVRGPGSSIYGDNAFFGTINLITRLPANTGPAATLGSGGNPSWRASAGLDRGRIRIRGEYLALDRFSSASRPRNDLLDLTGAKPIAASATVEHASLRHDRPLGRGSATFFAGAARTDTDIESDRITDRAAIASARIRLPARNSEFHLDAGLSYREQARGKPFPEGIYRQSLRAELDLYGATEFSGADSLLYGVQFSHRRMRDEYYFADGDDREMGVAAVYLENQLALLDRRLFINTGARLDRYPGFDPVISPRAGLIAILSPAAALKAEWGVAFRTPTLYDLYGRDPLLAPIYFEGDDELSVERVVSWNASWLFNSAGFRASVTAFGNDFEDLIAFEQVAFTPAYRLYRLSNQGHGWSRGVEAELRLRPAAGVELWGNYSHCDAYYEREGHALAAPWSPRHQGNAGVALAGPRAEFSAWASYTGGYVATTQDTPFAQRMEMDGYGTVSARASVRLADGLWLSASGHDLGGAGHYESPVFAPVVPWWFVSLDYGRGR